MLTVLANMRLGLSGSVLLLERDDDDDDDDEGDNDDDGVGMMELRRASGDDRTLFVRAPP